MSERTVTHIRAGFNQHDVLVFTQVEATYAEVTEPTLQEDGTKVDLVREEVVSEKVIRTYTVEEAREKVAAIGEHDPVYEPLTMALDRTGQLHEPVSE